MTIDSMQEVLGAHLTHRGVTLTSAHGGILTPAEMRTEMRELAEVACDAGGTFVTNLIEIDDPPAVGEWEIDARTRTIPPHELQRLVSELRG